MSKVGSKWERMAENIVRYSGSGKLYFLGRIGGKFTRKGLESTTLAAARREVRDLRGKFEHVDGRQSEVTVADLVDRYRRQIDGLAPASQQFRHQVANHIVNSWPGGPDRLARDVKASDVEEWLAHHASRVGVATRNEYLRAVRRVFAIGVADKVLATSPAAHMKEKRRPKPIRRTPTIEEFDAVVESIRAQPFSDTADVSADLVEFMGRAGVGNAECANLHWQHVDFGHGRITLFRAKTSTGYVLPMFPSVRPLMERLRKSDPSGGPEARVFRVTDAKKSIASACKRLNLPAFSHRSFRRMFIIRAIELGVDVKTIAEWQGHRDGGRLILSTYSHVRAPHSEAMAKLII